jgi:hypothetical protein
MECERQTWTAWGHKDPVRAGLSHDPVVERVAGQDRQQPACLERREVVHLAIV